MERGTTLEPSPNRRKKEEKDKEKEEEKKKVGETIVWQGRSPSFHRFTAFFSDNLPTAHDDLASSSFTHARYGLRKKMS